jgi:ATP-dependent Clp protease ATP-binding subunit ClpA
MYECFTDRARKVMQLANQEALRFNHEYIGTEHILLGLIKEGSGVAANVLKNLDIGLRKIRLEVEKIVQSGPDMVTMGKLPLTPRAKKVIEYAIDECRQLNHNYVGTEHLLLGLLREEEGVAAQVLINLGLSLDGVRREIFSLLGRNFEAGQGAGEKKPGSKTPRPLRRILRELDAQIEHIRQAKEEAVSQQDFERAARLRDEEDQLKRQCQELLRSEREIGPEVVLECDLHVPLQRNDGSPLGPETQTSIRDRLREQFGGLVETRIWIEGAWTFGPATLQGEVLVYRVFSSEPARATALLVALKEQLKGELQHENILIVTRKAKAI